MGSIARDALDQTVLLASVNDPEAAALIRELQEITDNDRYQFCERIRTLKAILAKLRPEPKREPLPPPKHYEPPRADRRL